MYPVQRRLDKDVSYVKLEVVMQVQFRLPVCGLDSISVILNAVIFVGVLYCVNCSCFLKLSFWPAVHGMCLELIAAELVEIKLAPLLTGPNSLGKFAEA